MTKDIQATGHGPEQAAVDLPREDLLRVAEEISSSFPPPRLGTELVLLEIDPQRAHAYWNIDMADYQQALQSVGEPAQLVLRMYDVTGIGFNGENAVAAFDLQVEGLQNHWYVNLWQHGRSYVADIGLAGEGGRFAALARSNEVQTPGAGPQVLVEEVAAVTPPAGPWAPPEEYAQPQPQAREALAELYRQMVPEDSAISHSGQEMSSTVQSTDPDVTVSSFACGGHDPLLEVHVEMRVYGRAKPGAQVFLDGHAIPLQPDGRFDVRRPMPPGTVFLPLTARAGDSTGT